MSGTRAQDYDETARLILLDGETSVSRFHHRMREVHPDATLLDTTALWGRYMGLDGRTRPTHDFNTGERL